MTTRERRRTAYHRETETLTTSARTSERLITSRALQKKNNDSRALQNNESLSIQKCVEGRLLSSDTIISQRRVRPILQVVVGCASLPSSKTASVPVTLAIRPE